MLSYPLLLALQPSSSISNIGVENIYAGFIQRVVITTVIKVLHFLSIDNSLSETKVAFFERDRSEKTLKEFAHSYYIYPCLSSSWQHIIYLVFSLSVFKINKFYPMNSAFY